MVKIIMAALLIINVPVVMGDDLQLRLNPGNNLVSVPLITTPPMTLEGLRALCQSAFVAYQGNDGKVCYYAQGMPDQTVDPGRAYLVNCQNASGGLIVRLTGTRASSTTVALHRGINWIGFPQGVPLGQTAQDVLKEQGLSLLMDIDSNGQFRTQLSPPSPLWGEGWGEGLYLENGKGVLLISSTTKTITLPAGQFLSRGSAIAFTKALTDPVGGSKIFMTEDQGGTWSTPAVIGPLDIYDRQPSFSKTDRNLLALASPFDCFNHGIFLFNLADNTFKRLTGKAANNACQPVRDLNPNFDIGADWILIYGRSTASGSKYDIARLPSNGDPQNFKSIFVTDNINETAPIYSPNGQTIYFLSDRDGQKKIWGVPASIITTPSTTEYRLSKTWLVSTLVASEDRLAVGPDGILYCGSQGRIYSVDPRLPADANAVALTAGPSDAFASVAPDGSRLAFVRNGKELWTCNWRGFDQNRALISETAISDTTWRP